MAYPQTSLGLKKGTLRLCPDSETLRDEAEAIRSSIMKHSGFLIKDIQHVGSTAIVGIPAKPILDFVIGVEDMNDIKSLINNLIEMGYNNRKLGLGSIGHLLVWEIAPLVRSQHLHIVKHESEHWGHYVLFRDHMNSCPSDRIRMKNLKEKMMENGVDRKEYQKNKSALVVKIWSKIVSEQGGSFEPLTRPAGL